VSITLYSADSCPYCVRTRLVLNGKAIAHEVVEIDLSEKPAWLRELNPRNRVPVIETGGAVLVESEVLNEYLEETNPDPPMLPPDAEGRARVRAVLRRFEDLTDAYYAARRQEPGAVEDAYAELDWVSEKLQAHEYLAGDMYTLADPGVWPWIVRMHRVGVDIGRYPAIGAWCDRLARRPEYAAELSLLPA
jgi:glutathione S-transferase